MPRFFVDGLRDPFESTLLERLESLSIPHQHGESLIFGKEFSPFNLVSMIASRMESIGDGIVCVRSPLVQVIYHWVCVKVGPLPRFDITKAICDTVKIAKEMGLVHDCCGLVVLDNNHPDYWIHSALKLLARLLGWRVLKVDTSSRFSVVESAVQEMLSLTFEQKEFSVSIQAGLVGGFFLVANRTWLIAPGKTITLNVRRNETIDPGSKLVVFLKAYFFYMGLKPAAPSYDENGNLLLRISNTSEESIIVYDGDKICELLHIPKIGCLGWIEC